ncbi:uncharacterized protein LOC131054474 [Cryptomeria japonica]|uniref:uncharacterized protein LOC131054474 n=1 Tax=Cryptomeria japonica TaxID=3369 RepID=UPI0027DA65F7|nr:uncharacterized protein LOC131054474 [Cryptomeria japonica]
MIPTDQRTFIEALEKVGNKDNKSNLPEFTSKMNPEEVVEWLEAPESHFECNEVVENQKIGEYRDKVLCDVPEMDSCHFLLGRPWKYDVNSQHDGKKNIYIVTKDGVSYTRTPLPDDNKDKRLVASVMLVNEKDLMKTLKEENAPCFAIVVKPKGVMKEKPTNKVKERSVGPKEVHEFLSKYQGIVAGRTLDTLPPHKDVSHCIDLIPGSTLPNKVVYKMTPEQNEEVVRHV